MVLKIGYKMKVQLLKKSDNATIALFKVLQGKEEFFLVQVKSSEFDVLPKIENQEFGDIEEAVGYYNFLINQGVSK